MITMLRDIQARPANSAARLGRELAAGIPNARFVALPGKNHVVLAQDPGAAQFLRELKSFIGTSRSRAEN